MGGNGISRECFKTMELRQNSNYYGGSTSASCKERDNNNSAWVNEKILRQEQRQVS